MITDYEHLTIGKFIELGEAVQAEEQDNDLRIVAILSGLTEEELLHLPLTEYGKLRDGAAFLFFQPPKVKPRRVYDIGGERYEAVLDFRKVNTAQYIDFKEIAAQEGDHRVDVLSIILVPEGKAYPDYDVYAVREKIREQFPVLDAIALLDFFAERLGTLTADTLTYSEWLTRKMKDKEKAEDLRRRIAEVRTLIDGGDGLGRWMRSVNSRAVLGVRYMR